MDNGTDPQPASEMVFEVCEDIYEGGYVASAIGFGIVTDGQTLKELRHNVMEAIDCYFDNPEDQPCFVRFHYVRDEVVAV